MLATIPMVAGPALAAQPTASAQPAAGANDGNTTTPIKHVIIIVGENRSFDHLFGTYVSPSEENAVRNFNPVRKASSTLTERPGQTTGRPNSFRRPTPRRSASAPRSPGRMAKLPPTNLNFTPGNAQSYTAPPYVSAKVAAKYDYGVLPHDLVTLTTGASGLPFQTIDTRIANVNHLPSGPYQLSPGVTTDSYANSPVHRFYQMFQQLDCSATYATTVNPSGCRADLFPWVEVTVGAGTNGHSQPPGFNDESTHEGAVSMGFYNVQQGDLPYLKSLADQYTILDNYHQPAKGGTGLDSLYLGYADDVWYSDGKGNAITPPANQIENPDPQPGTNNWYAQDGYSGGTYSNCSDTGAPGVAPVNAYLSSLHVNLNCEADHYLSSEQLQPGLLR